MISSNKYIPPSFMLGAAKVPAVGVGSEGNGVEASRLVSFVSGNVALLGVFGDISDVSPFDKLRVRKLDDEKFFRTPASGGGIGLLLGREGELGDGALPSFSTCDSVLAYKEAADRSFANESEELTEVSGVGS